ncbi:MAG: DUF4149 domain-containing protein [Proteobacteria bacterium]|nr:DUF4149 domain-containing protein [Pseudomonadota bacterium]
MRAGPRLILALWAGGLVSLGGVVTPTLFATLEDARLAGRIAGSLFHVATLGSVLVCLVLLLVERRVQVSRPTWRQWLGRIAPVLLLAASEWGVRPLLEAARAAGGSASTEFALWHGVSTALYVAATAWVVATLAAELRR